MVLKDMNKQAKYMRPAVDQYIAYSKPLINEKLFQYTYRPIYISVLQVQYILVSIMALTYIKIMEEQKQTKLMNVW